ncbi:MAG TPA: hypothetical protein VFU47_04830, partial [Armatimonadota bacterium]|nr:hypothetical protein [Armatimonadota bacterium]
MRRLTLPVGLVLLAALATPAQARAQARPRPEPSTPAAQQPPPSPSVPLQTQADDYTRYELLEPASHAFRILYDVTATTPGATQFLNGIRIGSEAKVDAVYDRMSGEKLPFDVVPGSEARANGLPDAPLEERFIRVRLARPVPADGGEARLRIDKTYTDSASYGGAAETLVFRRSLSIKRNAVVLPPGWELVGVNYPSQVAMEADGRIRVSFWNAGPAAVPYEVRARALPPAAVAAATAKAAPPLRDDVAPPAARPTPSTPGAPAPAPTGASAATGAPAAPAAAGAPAGGGRARVAYVVPERALQDREIVYYLQQPETHAFRLYHDYTESRAGVDRYVNVVRAGSRSADPAARILDTGRVLEVETLRGAAIVGRKIDIGEEIGPE